jgi:hypothetical protein
MTNRKVISNFFLTMILLLSVRLTPAQESRGQLLGRVTDASGSVIVTATVRAMNSGTSVETTAATNETGDYLLPFLMPGAYTLQVTAPGFKQFVQAGITIRAGDKITLDVKLPVGETREKIQVTAEAPLIQAANASLDQVIDQRLVTELPILNANPTVLMLLAPGIVITTGATSLSGSQSFTATEPSNGITDTGVFGAGARNSVTIDGAVNQWLTRATYNPPPETVQEVRTSTVPFDAASGFFASMTVDISLKSGTNALHGSAVWSLQNPVLNANRFFTNLAGLPKAATKQNRWGVFVGGPVRIPHFYDGRDKTFFFVGYDGSDRADPRGAVTTGVPMPGQTGGDFSALLKLGANYQIYDPATIASAANGRFSRQPFPGNIIPSSRIDPLAARLAKFWLPPNLPGTPDGTNNWTTPGPEFINNRSYLLRLDHNFSDRDRSFFRMDQMDTDWVYNQRFNNADGQSYVRQPRGMAADWVHIFSPRLLVESRAAITRYTVLVNPLTHTLPTFDLATLGFSKNLIDAANQIDPRGVKLPQIIVSGLGNLGDDAFNFQGFTEYQLATNVTRMLRAHTVRFGAEFRTYQANENTLGQSSGSLSFGSTWTNGPLDNSTAAPQGQGLASFLLGIPSGGSIAANDSAAQQERAYGFYLQDDWKATSRLTLNFGLRWEIESPETERFNRYTREFNPTAISPIAAQAIANYAANPIPQVPTGQFRVQGGLVFAGVNGVPRGLFNTNLRNMAPRFGFAYRLDFKTVIRGGYAIYDHFLGIIAGQELTGYQQGFNYSTALVPSVNNGLNFVASLANPFPNGYTRPQGASLGLGAYLGQAISTFNPNMKQPYFQRWQVGVQRQLPGKTVLEISYVGNKAVRLPIMKNLDTIPAQYLSTLGVRDQPTINTLTAAAPNPFYPLLPGTSLSGNTAPVSQLLLPYPQFSSVTSVNNQGYNWYHSLQARVEKRYSAGLTVVASFAYSKLMEAISYLNPTDPTPYRSIASMDRPFIFTGSGIWELPFGPGKPLLSHWAGVPGKIVGGWQIQVMASHQSGQALSWGNVIFNGNIKDIALPADQRTWQHWFNTKGFVTSSTQQLANNIRTFPLAFSGVRGDSEKEVDMSIFKNFHLREGLTLEFRAESNNAFNMVMFDLPNMTPSSQAFGQVSAEGQPARSIQLGLKIKF